MGERFGNYELVRRIAQGGMAEVFLARFTGVEGFERWVVIKRMLPELAVRKDFVEMFLDEARLAARFNHPNIVQVYELGEQAGSYFMAMEYVDGPHLGALFAHSLRQKKPLPINLCCFILARASEGLHHAHELKDQNGIPLQIVHRDVSPQNIMVSKDADIKVMDFGVAKANSQTTVTRTGVVKGKVGYMSPEQCLANPVDRRTDVFALGIVLYELVTRKRLFRDKSDLVVMQKITGEDVPAPSTVNARIPPELDELIMRSLARDMNQRTPDALTLSDELDAYLATRGEATTRNTLARWMTENAQDITPSGEQVSHPTPSWSAAQSPSGGSSASRRVTGALSTAPTAAPGPDDATRALAVVDEGTQMDDGTPAPTARRVSNPSNPQMKASVVAAPDPAAALDVPDTTPPEAPPSSRMPLMAGAALLGFLLVGGGVWTATRNSNGSNPGASKDPIKGASSSGGAGHVAPASALVAGPASGGSPAVSSPAVGAVEKLGALRIVTDPPHAEVTVNKQPRGSSESGQILVDKLPMDPPEAAVVVTLEGYDTQRMTIPLVAGETVTLPVIRLHKTAAPKPGQGIFEITTDPSNVRIIVDGKPVGRSPMVKLELREGSHSLLVEGPPGYQSIKTTIKSVSGMKQQLPYTLEKAERAPVKTPEPKEPEGVGKLTVDTQPYWTNVFLGGKMLGPTPLPGVELPAGKAVLKFRRDGKDGCNIDVTRTVEIVPNQLTKKVFTLEAKDAKGNCQ